MESNLTQINDFLVSDPGFQAGAILDVRPQALFGQSHLRGAVSHPLAKACSPEAVPSIHLPPRHVPLLLVGDVDQELASLAEDLAGRGRVGVSQLVLSQKILDQLPRALIEVGLNRRHLWQPPGWLQAHLGLLPPPAMGPVLDLGCGSGRAAVWMAERGYRVTGVDWQPEALDMGRQLAASRGVRCQFVEADLRNLENVPAGPWSLILNFRYLQRDFFEHFNKWLAPGGLVLIRTFRSAPGYEGHPQPRHRLSPGELAGSFPAGHFEVLAHEESFDPDGRPAAGIVARRRS